MKRLFAILIIVILFSGFFYLKFVKKNQIFVKQENSMAVATPTQPEAKEKTFIFIPYWSFNKTIDSENYDSLIYFGIGVNKEGIDTNDPGYKKIKAFKDASNTQKERILVVRMTNSATNTDILKNEESKKRIIKDSIQIAKENSFNGVLLDFETSAFGFDTTIKRNTDFYSEFSQSVKKEKLLFYISVFGDNYFQSRAYDLKEISKSADRVIVMAYDFHKARSNPGPNFPFDQKDIYGYDFKKMIEDFQKDVLRDKLVIAFGYFGYDWKVDKEGNSIETALPLSLFQMEERFGKDCKLQDCIVKKNSALESNAAYKEGDNQHVVWFEDRESVQKKVKYLQSQGILQTAAWAYSYF